MLDRKNMKMDKCQKEHLKMDTFEKTTSEKEKLKNKCNSENGKAEI